MAQTGFATATVILAGLVLVIPASVWAAAPSPALMATPPQPKWSELSVPQKIVLAPLSDDWDAMENYRQKKWLSIATRFPEMTALEQRRIQAQMQSWDKLSPEERQAARENYRTTSKLSSEKKKQLQQKWEEYSSLPVAEKEKLKQLAENHPPQKPSLPIMPLTAAPAAATAPLPPGSAPGNEAPAKP